MAWSHCHDSGFDLFSVYLSPYNIKSKKKAEDVYVLQGDGRDFLSAVWTGVQGGTTGARDIQIKFKDDKEMCISSTVLSSVGQYFQAMLDCGLRESQENKVTLPTVTQSTFTRLVAFILGQKVETETREDVVELLEAAEMMQIQSLVDACIEQLPRSTLVRKHYFNPLAFREFRPNKKRPGNERDFLSAVWSDVQGGTTGARDIHIKFSDDKEICVSSTVLYNMVQYFQVMLDCGLRESRENKVTLATVTQSTFTRLMAFTLGQKVETEAREDVVELLEAAEMMQIPKLVDDCTEWLLANTTADNCLDTFLLVRMFRPNKVKRAISSVIVHMKSACKSDDWCALDEECISIIMKEWATSAAKKHIPEMFRAILRWIETNGADQDTSTQLFGWMGIVEISDFHDSLPDHSYLLKNPMVMKAVREGLKPRGEITLLVVGSAESKGDDCTRTHVYCWSENVDAWSVLPPPPKELPKNFAVAKSGNTLIISGGMRKKYGPSKKIWVADKSGWREIEGLTAPRSNHGMAFVEQDLCIVGGLPGPMKSIEMRMKRYQFRRTSRRVGTLREAVYDCGVAAVKDRLIVVGGCSSEGPRNIIQTFHAVSHAVEVITLPESPGLQLDTGFTRYLGTLDSLLFLSRSGHLLEVQVDDDAVTLQSQVLLKDFHHQSPFAAILDCGGVVVCDSRSADCRYSLDGEKKEQTTIVRRLRDDIQVHSVFRCILPS